MTMQQGGPAKLDHRCIVAYAFCVIFLSGWLPAVYADKERSLEDFAEVYVDQYFEPDESLVLSGEGKKKSQALANYALGRSLEAKGRPLEAVEAYRKVLENQPDRYFLARKTAYLLARSGQQSEALEVLEENIEKNPDEPFAHIALSEYLATYQANDPDAVKRSLSVAKEAVERFPEEPAVYEHLVKVYMTGNRRGEARQVIVDAAKSDNQDPEFWLRLGQLGGRVLSSQSNGPIADAALLNELFGKAHQYAGENWKVVETVGDFYHATRQFDNAISAYTEIVEESPDRLDVREKIARVYAGKGDTDKYVETLKEILEIDPQNVRAHKNIAKVYLTNKQFVEAIPHLRTALAITKGTAQEYGALGEMMIDNGEFDLAVEFLDESAYLFPEVPTFRLLMADALEKSERFEEATKQYKEAEKIAEEFEPQILGELFYFRYAAAHERAGNIETAGELFQRTLDLLAKNDPELQNADFAATVYNYLGYMWLENDMKIEEAGELIKTAAEMNPESGAIADSLGWFYFKQGDFEEARDELLRAEQLIEQADPVIYDHIGQVFHKLGENQSAVEYMKKAAEMDPENKEIGERLAEYTKLLEGEVTKPNSEKKEPESKDETEEAKEKAE
ncbi:MAG: hypothetical protein CMO55_03565 [Verrucomicrobiales bacterium]|nr:hypothetical protein [Verrucomicrobiales bacterium]